MKNKIVIIAILVAILSAGGGFYAGMKYQQSKTPSFGGRLTPGEGIRGQTPEGRQLDRSKIGTGGVGFRPVSGEITSKDEGSITVSMQDGSSKIILLTEDTSVSKSEEGSQADLEVGEQVSIFGTENSDGSVTAQNVQLNPELGGILNREP